MTESKGSCSRTAIKRAKKIQEVVLGGKVKRATLPRSLELNIVRSAYQMSAAKGAAVLVGIYWPFVVAPGRWCRAIDDRARAREGLSTPNWDCTEGAARRRGLRSESLAHRYSPNTFHDGDPVRN